MSKLAKALTAAAGNAGQSLYVEDVFSTYLYTGNGSTQTITNGIDLAGEGGMVWTKERSPNSRNHFIGDSERNNFRNYLYTNLANAESGLSGAGFDISSVSSTGYSLGADNYTWNNESGSDQVSWTFRKAEKFFDVVTYTGTGAVQNIAHNLGVAPACIIVKSTTNAQNWYVYHESLGNTQRLLLDSTVSAATSSSYWNNTSPTDSVFTVGIQANVNTSGATYVAYLFASDAGGFGDDDESIIKCGSFTQGTTASSPTGNVTVNLGFEPQWLLIKNTTSGSDWVIYDAMRGVTAPVGGASYPTSNRLRPNTDDVENNTGQISINSTGFTAHGGATTASDVEIYIAIRRPMKTPESGTEVYNADFYGSTEANNSSPIVRYYAGFPVDFTLFHDRTGGGNHQARARLTGANYLHTNLTDAEIANSSDVFGSNQGIQIESTTASELTRYIRHMFKRATGFFDVVCYTGDGTSSRDITHNLGAVPEFIVTKRRDTGAAWAVYHPDLGITSTSAIRLNSADGWGYSQLTRYPSTPTSTVYTIGNDSDVNTSSGTYVSYLFATLAGVSKVGSYTGTGADLNVDCGFSAGARWVMIKRYGTSTTGDWYIWDSERGIVAGNDPYLLLNSTAAEVTSTDYIDPLSSGFTVTSSAPAALNASGGTYIYLAIS